MPEVFFVVVLWDYLDSSSMINLEENKQILLIFHHHLQSPFLSSSCLLLSSCQSQKQWRNPKRLLWMNHDSQRGYLKIVEDEMLPKILFCGKKIFLDMRYFNMVLLIKAYDVTVIHSREEGLSFQNFVCIIYIYIYKLPNVNSQLDWDKIALVMHMRFYLDLMNGSYEFLCATART